jgi:H+/gluconate symporter-like permease
VVAVVAGCGSNVVVVDDVATAESINITFAAGVAVDIVAVSVLEEIVNAVVEILELVVVARGAGTWGLGHHHHPYFHRFGHVAIVEVVVLVVKTFPRKERVIVNKQRKRNEYHKYL